MSKQLYVDPVIMRTPGVLKFKDIPLNTYQKKVEEEKDNFSKKDLINIYRDMCYIREFESMIQSLKKEGEYRGTKYSYPGPAQLGIGQEAAYVGQAYHLGIDDFSFGSHRSHGEVIARGLRMVETLPEDKLQEIIGTINDGETLKVIGDGCENIRELGLQFFFYGLTCEVFGRKNGFNRGLGGSMHSFFAPFGIYPNNAIVGASATIAPGAALYKLVNRKDGIVVCNIGDGALACGPVWEGMVFSSMDQIRELWGDEFGGMPIIFNVWNNSYAMGGQPAGETMGCGMMARVGAGVMPSQMHVERIDGYNPLAVIDAYNRKIDVAKKEGPVLIEVVTYRYCGHSPSDISTYRTEDEINAWKKQDSIEEFARQLIDAEVVTKAELESIENKVEKDVHRNMELAIDEKISPRLDLFNSNKDAISSLMYSNKKVRSFDVERKPETLCKLEESPRFKQIATKSRFAFDKSGNTIPESEVYNLRDAIIEPILRKYYEDPTFISFGEDLRDWGGSFAVYRGITEAIPYHRLFNAPISEAAIVGAAVGYAMCGGRAVVELMYMDMLGRAGDEIFNQLSKWQAMSAGALKMPVVVRMSVGSRYGAQHSQDWSAICAHIPGLKVCFPATPYDAKGLMHKALNGTDPVIFLESQRIYDVGERFYEGGVPKEEYEIEFGEPEIKINGDDITILSIGATLYRAVSAVKELKEKYGVGAELIDARSIVPFNYEKVIESVKKTGHIIIVGDACERNSFMRNLASNISEFAFEYLKKPPVVVGTRNWITPACELEESFFPQPGWILDAINERVFSLEGHVCSRDFTKETGIYENKLGI